MRALANWDEFTDNPYRMCEICREHGPENCQYLLQHGVHPWCAEDVVEPSVASLPPPPPPPPPPAPAPAPPNPGASALFTNAEIDEMEAVIAEYELMLLENGRRTQ